MIEPIFRDGWIDEAEARDRYETSKEGFSLINAEAHDSTVVPRFVIEVSGSAAPNFRCRFLNPAGSVTRVIDYRNQDGRLFKELVADYHYPDDEHRYSYSDATLTYTGAFEPDGYAP